MRCANLFFFLCCIFLQSHGQSPNDWLKESERFFKFQVSEDGIYKINLTENLPNELANPHIIHHGKEVPIQRVETNGESHIIFYAERNKGELDSLVYRPVGDRPVDDYSLFTDASSYFLYFNDKPSLLAASLSPSQSSSSATLISKKIHRSFREQYSFNNSIGLLPLLQQSYYETGEGWTGPFVSIDSVYTYSFDLGETVQEGTELNIDFQLNGRSRNPHLLKWYVNGDLQPDTLSFGDFETVHRNLSVVVNEASNKIDFTFEGIRQAEFDWYSITDFTTELPSVFDPNKDQDFKVFGFSPINLNDGYLVEYQNRWSYRLASGGTRIGEEGSSYRFFSIARNLVSLELFEPRSFSKEANYIIITDPSLKAGADAFAAYRSSSDGGGFNTEIVFTQDVYDHFNYGERSPIAIRNYLQWLGEKGFDNKFVLLLGRAITFPDVIKRWEDQDLVPSFGYPGSDALFSTGLDASLGQNVQAFATGRLNVTTNQEILNYLAKVKEHESFKDERPWQKEFLHLSGGRSTFELSQLSSMLESLKPIASSSLWRPKITSTRKATLQEIEPIDISSQVNEGLGMITFAGHGSANVIDLNIGYASAPESSLNNKGKYPIMYFNGCGVGNVFYRYDPLSTDWLLAKDKGAIAVFANSFWSYLFSSQLWLNSYYQAFLGENTGLRIGQIHQRINARLSSFEQNDYIRANMHQVVLQGDPALRFFDIEKEEYFIPNNGLFVKSQENNLSLGNTRNKEVGLIIGNAGRFNEQRELKGEITLSFANEPVQRLEFSIPVMELYDTVFVSFQGGELTKVEAVVNSQNMTEEKSEANNAQVIEFNNWEEQSLGISWPRSAVKDRLGPVLWNRFDGRLIEPNSFVAQNSTISVYLKDENPMELSNAKYLISIQECPECEPVAVDFEVSKIDAYTLKADFTGPSAPGNYVLQARGFDEEGNISSTFIEQQFRISENQKPTQVLIYPNPSREFKRLRTEIESPSAPVASTIRIYDLIGRLVQEFEVDLNVGLNDELLEQNALPTGTYILQLTIDWGNEEERFEEKLIFR